MRVMCISRRSPQVIVAIALLLGAAGDTLAEPAGQKGTGTVRVDVKDQTGAVLPGALVQVRPLDDAAGAAPASAAADSQGRAVLEGLVPGRYSLLVSFPGFATHLVPEVRVRAGTNRREVTLALDRFDESVSVARDPGTSASDPRAERFGNFLSREQIDALPDDPEELERALEQMAGPGGVIRVDGFRGGKLPPKSQIRSIRFASGMYAAENHGGGVTFVDIATQPGMGPLRGSVEVTFRDAALNARNAFHSGKAPEGAQQYALNLSGTLLRDRTSFSLSAGGASAYDSAAIFAARADGSRADGLVRRPSDRTNVHARIDHALTRSHTLRGTFQRNASDLRNLGVGGFDLPDRAFGRVTGERTLRVSESGPWSRSLFGDTRLQVRWSDLETTPELDSPAVRVLDAFTAGGAQQAGGRTSTEVEWAVNVDWARGRHSVRIGSLLEGGRYRSSLRSNYLGTYTFASLDDFAAGRPATYTQRTGDPLVEFTHLKAGLFVQDDWRVQRNLTLSLGVRQELQTRVPDHINLAPRAGFTWSPFRHGRTTIRGGAGIFYEWLEAEVYEQTLRVDGVRQVETVIRNPGYPDPHVGGFADVLPPSRYVLADGLVLPIRRMAGIGLSQQLSGTLSVNLNLSEIAGSNHFRGRNVNAPLGGVRPDPAAGNVTQVESTGRMRARQVHAGLSVNLPSRRTFLFANYTFVDQYNDSDGPFGLPANSHDPGADWGPAAGLPRHSASALLNMPLGSHLRLGVTTTARSGGRYNVTTGRDDNGDTVFTDRPAGVRRNSARAAGMWEVAARISYAFGFGRRPSGDGGAGPVMVVHRGGSASAGDLLGGLMGAPGAEDKRVRFELFASAQNLLNAVTPIGYSGVMTSPFFGRPTAAMPARRIDVGLRVGF